MARYLLTAAVFLNGSLRREGEIVEFDGPPSKAMELIGDDTPKAASKPQRKKGAADDTPKAAPPSTGENGEPASTPAEPATGQADEATLSGVAAPQDGG